jgi:DNA-binding IclR family transcriptional regulator
LNPRQGKIVAGIERARETGTLGKLMALLDVVALSDSPMRFTDILARSNQPRGTLHRQLTHLTEEGLLEIDRDGRYHPGIRLLHLASHSWSRNQFRTLAEPHLRKLQEQTGETVHLGVLRGAEVIYLDKVEGRQSVRMYSQIGNASPAYCTGVGKAALSTMDDLSLHRLVDTLVFHPFTEHTHLSAASLLADIHAARQLGHTFDLEEHEQGICCVAAPIRSDVHDILAGVSVTGPAYRLTVEKLTEYAPLVRATAATITADLHARLGPRG